MSVYTKIKIEPAIKEVFVNLLTQTIKDICEKVEVTSTQHFGKLAITIEFKLKNSKCDS